MSENDKPFYVGYFPVPAPLRALLLGVALVFIGAMAALGLAVGATQDDPGAGAFRADFGRQTITGVIDLTPYPMVHVTQGNDRIKTGHTMMLSGPGKNGIQTRAAKLEGQLATVSGIVLERGTIHMLQVAGGRRGLSAAEGSAAEVPSEDLGRWKLAGEICDGKCLTGAMRPGRGLAHKACANLCILGGVPPVFVSTQPVAGSEFLMIGSAQGAGLSARMLDHVGQYISVEGQVERRGNILIFLVDDSTVEVL